LLELAFDANASNAWRSSCGAGYAPRRNLAFRGRSPKPPSPALRATSPAPVRER